MTERQKRTRLTAQRKFQIYLDTRGPEAPVGEVLRKNGLTLEDLRAIEEAVESGAIQSLKVRTGHHKLPTDVTGEQYAALARELREKERALADLVVENQLLKKSEDSDFAIERGENLSPEPRRGPSSRQSGRRRRKG